MFAHPLGLVHGFAAALLTVAVFSVTGLLLLPRRRWNAIRWPDCFVLGLMSYVVPCWVATTSRGIPVNYVTILFGAAVWGLAAVRLRSLQAALGSPHTSAGIRTWLVGFGLCYAFAYVLVLPPAGAAVLALPSDGALDLVTYARYAKHLMMFGTADVDLATFGYPHSPAGTYLLAWHSLLFRGDPLDAAIPLLLMLAALFGTIAVEIARSVFGLSWRAAMVIAAVALCAPIFRWTYTAFLLGELVSAMAVLYLAGVLGRAAVTRCLDGWVAFGLATGGTLLLFGPWPTSGSAGSGVLQIGPILLLPLVPLVWAAAAWALRRSPLAERIGLSDTDRRLAGALTAYIAAAVIAGNVAVQAVERPAPPNRPAAWRELGQISRMPFRSFTLKAAEEPHALATALAMYYLPGRQASVIGRGVSLDKLPFEHVSRQQPMFIQDFGCEGVGHGDTVPAPLVGCVLMAPPSMAVGTSYPFNRTFLFVHFDRMSTRDPGGRWNTDPTLNLQFTADPQRLRLDREMFINFLVNPFLPANLSPLRLVVRWGDGRRGEVAVGDMQWFSLSVRRGDWRGHRLWTLPVAIDVPDGRTILFYEASLTETPRGQVADMGRAGR